MSVVSLKLYEQFVDAPDDKSRARALAEAFEAFENRYPEIRDLATGGMLRESELKLTRDIKEVELKLTKEIEGVRREIEIIRKEIEVVRKEIKDTELKLIKEIENSRRETRDTEVRLHRAIVNQTRWFLGGLAVLGTIFKLVDMFVG